MKTREQVKAEWRLMKLHMVEGIFQGVDPCGVSEWDREYDSYAKAVMQGVDDGMFPQQSQIHGLDA